MPKDSNLSIGGVPGNVGRIDAIVLIIINHHDDNYSKGSVLMSQFKQINGDKTIKWIGPNKSLLKIVEQF